MQQLLKNWFLIATLQDRPDNLPGDRHTMYRTAMAAVVTNILATLVLMSSRFFLPEALLDVTLAAVCLLVALSRQGKPERFNQSFSAYCGVSVVINLASVVLLGPFYIGQVPDSVGTSGLFAGYLLLVWSIAAIAHIVRHTFEIPMPAGVGVAVIYVLVYLQLVGLVVDF